MFMAVYIQQTESESVQKSTSNPPSALNTGWEFFIFIYFFFFPNGLAKSNPKLLYYTTIIIITVIIINIFIYII